MAKFNVRLPVTGFTWVIVEAEDEKGAIEAASQSKGCVSTEEVTGLFVDCSGQWEPVVVPVVPKPISKRAAWLNVLTDEQKKIRSERRYDEINLTQEQKEILGEEGCCWITSPTFYASSHWCS